MRFRVAIGPGFRQCPPVFRGVLLDLDDTLYDRSAAFDAWADGIATIQLGRRLDPAEREDLIAFDRRGHRSRARFAEDARRLGLMIDPEKFPFDLADHVVPEDGVRDTIAELVRTRRIAIVTNGGPAQRVKLERIGLDGLVRTVMVSGELGIAKPDLRIFQRALAWSELDAKDVVFVGDHPLIDLAPASSIGMATAWRVRGDWPEELAAPSYRITQIAQLREICA